MATVRGFLHPRTATGRSSLIPSPPWHYSGDLLTVEYRADPARVAELLPAPLSLADEDPGAVAIIWADWQSCSASGEELLDPVRARRLRRHGPVDPERDGDVLPVDEDVQHRVAELLPRREMAGPGRVPQVRRQPLRRPPGRLPPGGGVDHPVEAPARPDRLDQDPPEPGARCDAQVGGHLADPPPGAQRRALPLVGGQPASRPATPARARLVRLTPEARWTAHLGRRRMDQLRDTLARLREITDPYLD